MKEYIKKRMQGCIVTLESVRLVPNSMLFLSTSENMTPTEIWLPNHIRVAHTTYSNGPRVTRFWILLFLYGFQINSGILFSVTMIAKKIIYFKRSMAFASSILNTRISISMPTTLLTCVCRLLNAFPLPRLLNALRHRLNLNELLTPRARYGDFLDGNQRSRGTRAVHSWT